MNSPSQIARILWVDDDRDILDSIARLLRKKDRKIDTATSFNEGLELLKNNTYDVVAADHRLEERNGLDLLELAREISPRTSRILITGQLEQELVSDAINRAGVFRFILKPWDDAELEIDLRAAIERRRELVLQQTLVRDISQKNQALETLRAGLENLVSERTRKIAESKAEIETQQRHVRSIVKLVEELASLDTFHELIGLIRRELRSRFSPCDVFLIRSADRVNFDFFFLNGQEPQQTRLQIQSPAEMDAISSHPEMRRILADAIGRPVGKIDSWNVHADSNELSKAALWFLVEHHQTELVQKQGASSIDSFVRSRWLPIKSTLERIWLGQKLRSAAMEWEQTFDGIQDPIAIVDKSFGVLRANREFLRTQSSEPCHKLFAQQEQPCVGCPLTDEDRTTSDRPGQIRVGRKSYEVYSYPIELLRGIPYEARVNRYLDVTDKRELYSQMIQNEKMAAVGLLAGNIAHELNNPLTGIRSLAQLVRQDLATDSRMASDIEEVEKAAQRCQAIISNLLSFVKPEEERRDLMDLRVVVERTMGLLKTAVRDHNREVHSPEDPVWVRGDEQMLQQVVFNLVNNACQAMKNPGTVAVHIEREGSKGFIRVVDTGPGIPLDIQERIFDPFFTTKPEGEGTGLGLSMSRAIIENMGGRLSAGNRPDQGAEFVVELPVELPSEQIVRQLREPKGERGIE